MISQPDATSSISLPECSFRMGNLNNNSGGTCKSVPPLLLLSLAASRKCFSPMLQDSKNKNPDDAN